MNILFVCTGNISRSYLAEYLLKNEVEKRKLKNVSVASVGVSGLEGSPPDPKMVQFLSDKGIPFRGHRGKPMELSDAEWADMILVMEKFHYLFIKNNWPEMIEKSELLSHYLSDGQPPYDIADPFNRSPYHYRLAQSQIFLAVGSLVQHIQSLND